MNNPSPLVPQGSLLEQKNQGRARVRIAVFFVLAVHGVGLLALLMQGCNKPEQPPPTATTPEPATTSPPPAFVAPTNAPAPVATEPAVTSPAGNLPIAETTPPPVLPGPGGATPAPAVPAGMSEYKVVKGDSFSSIAKKSHVSLKALMDANPGVEPTKLQVGQTIHIPPTNPAAPLAVPSVTSPGGATGAAGLESLGGEQIYTVKSGDNLSKIASHFEVSLKALRAANNLKTDRITVGQKLKIPAKASTPAPNAPASGTETAPTNPPSPAGAGPAPGR